MDGPYNPLDKQNLGRSVSEALLTSSISSLAQIGDLVGAGVYAIYYTGAFTSYAHVSAKNRAGTFDQPIYVGKAVPKGARKGGLSFDASKGKALYDRLRKHASSIAEATNLDLLDFHFRCLNVEDIWIPLGENMLIEQFQPIWNLVIDGFGNNDPGRRRATQYRSSWDVLHPGRQFAEKLAPGATTVEMLNKRLEEYFAGKAVPLVPTEEAGDVGNTEDEED